MTEPDAVADPIPGSQVAQRRREAGTPIEKFDKANEEANEANDDKGAKEITPVRMNDSSDDEALLGKTYSEAGDGDALDQYFAMEDDWMHRQLGIGGSSDEEMQSTLNPNAPEFEPYDQQARRSRWEANGYGIYEKHLDQEDWNTDMYGGIVQYDPMDYSIEGDVIKYKGKIMHGTANFQPRANFNEEGRAAKEEEKRRWKFEW